MSCYGWERGTLVLPTAAVSSVKKSLRDASNDLFDRVLTEAKNLHKGMGTTNPKKYLAKVRELKNAEYALKDRQSSNYGYYGWRSDRKPAPSVAGIDVRIAALNLLADRVQGGYGYDPEPKADLTRVTVPTVADVVKYTHLRKYTNKDNMFVVSDHGFESATIFFKGREVTWDVSENNHAVDTAHDSFLAKVFFHALDNVKWTRGTGGVFVGNDEYNRDSEYAGGGGNYITSRFGPLGEKQSRVTYYY